MKYNLIYNGSHLSLEIVAMKNRKYSKIQPKDFMDILNKQDRLYEEGEIDSYFCSKAILIEGLEEGDLILSLLKLRGKNEEGLETISVRMVVANDETNEWVHDNKDLVMFIRKFLLQLYIQPYEDFKCEVIEKDSTSVEMKLTETTVH